MKPTPTPFAAIAIAVVSSLAMAAIAGALPPGEHDEDGLRLLRAMSASIPLRTTSLEKIAPNFAVEKQAGLAWSEAVAEADTRFGARQPERAAFLRKYLAKASPEDQLAQLQWPASGSSTITGSGISKGFILGPWDKPTATITVWIGAQHQLLAEPTLALATATVDGVVYSDLTFDTNDRLISAGRQLPPEADGSHMTIGQNNTGQGGVNFFWVRISSPGGQSELIDFTPKLVIKTRSVNSATQRFRELYENGRLTRRLHYADRQVEAGTQTYVEREEKFP